MSIPCLVWKSCLTLLNTGRLWVVILRHTLLRSVRVGTKVFSLNHNILQAAIHAWRQIWIFRLDSTYVFQLSGDI